MTSIQTPIGGWHRPVHARTQPIAHYPWEGKLLHELRGTDVPQYWDGERWVVIPVAQHSAYKAYRRQLAKRLPLMERMLDDYAGFWTRALFIVTVPISAPLVFVYGYGRAILRGGENW